jgi:hypothetical protein
MVTKLGNSTYRRNWNHPRSRLPLAPAPPLPSLHRENLLLMPERSDVEVEVCSDVMAFGEVTSED